MKSLKSICVALCAALVLSGCNWNNTAKGTAIGAGGGAALGAIVGALAGNTAIGAVIGTAVGAGAGAIIGKKMDKAKKEAGEGDLRFWYIVQFRKINTDGVVEGVSVGTRQCTEEQSRL